MLKFGQDNCNALQSTTVNDDLQRATYYDAQRVYFQINDYTKDAKWALCGNYTKLHYRDSYIIGNGGSIPGYWVFANGLAQDYKRNNNTVSLNALNLMAANASYCRGTAYELGALSDPALSRENAYCLMMFIERRKLGITETRVEPYRDFAKAHASKWNAKQTPWVKPFMSGLTAQALIQYYEQIKADPEIVTLLSGLADRLWTEFWDDATQSFFYVDNPLPNDDGHIPAPDLNLLISPMFEWLYKQTGQARFRVRGDLAFEGGVKGAWLVGGKQFNQNYMWSFDQVKWRAVVAPSPTPQPTATPCGTTATLKNHQCRLNKAGL